MLQAVLFDFDGTLVDTMPIHYEAYRRVFESQGLTLTKADFFDNIGGKATETIPKFLGGQECALSVREIHTQKKAVVNDLLANGPLTILETAKLLDAFHGLCPIALVSSGSRPGIEIVLNRLGWSIYFELVITGEDVTKGKPHPEPFLLAAHTLNVDPAACLVMEDTDDGVQAAEAAGMKVFDVRKTTPSHEVI